MPVAIGPERDPRTNPQPGDVTTNGRETFWVTRVDRGTVYYTDQPPLDEMEVSLAQLIENAEHDTVVKRAEGSSKE